MAIPNSANARLFYRCAFRRYEEAEVLLNAGYTTGAVYLAGYGVECILKALVIAAVGPAKQTSIMKSFRGGKAHDYDWLRTLYLTNGGARFPGPIARCFTLVNDWTTDLRYSPRTVHLHEADEFLKAAVAIIKWADSRF